MFESVAVAPSDPILGLSEAFAKDERPTKVNLAVGVFKDATGATPILETVREAERRLLASTRTKSYKPIDGDPAYGRVVRGLLFGKDSVLAGGGLAATAHAPGGTGALRLAADYLAAVHGRPKVWMSQPTWANHPKIFESAGLQCATYRYFDPSTNALDVDGRTHSVDSGPPSVLAAFTPRPSPGFGAAGWHLEAGRAERAPTSE